MGLAVAQERAQLGLIISAGIRKTCLIVNLPGKPSSIRECLEAVWPAIPDCVELAGGAYLEGKPTAPAVFRPRAK